jgi:hypothetical protein
MSAGHSMWPGEARRPNRASLELRQEERATSDPSRWSGPGKPEPSARRRRHRAPDGRWQPAALEPLEAQRAAPLQPRATPWGFEARRAALPQPRATPWVVDAVNPLRPEGPRYSLASLRSGEEHAGMPNRGRPLQPSTGAQRMSIQMQLWSIEADRPVQLPSAKLDLEARLER